jgi:hypothetical protein
MIDKGSKALNHFTRLAARGLLPGCSTFERRAWLIALAICKGLEGFDGQALQGMAEFAADAAAAPEVLRVWVESRALEAERAGRKVPGKEAFR